jgi:UDPglucose 6-dehydrogenase
MSRICVIGAGYVGLVTGAGLAHLGHSVVTLEVDRERLSRIIAGRLPIQEPGLDELVAEKRAAGLLEFSDSYAAAIPSADYVFLAVNTPPLPDGDSDTTFVFNAVRTVLEHARPGVTIVTKSTVPVGTGDRIEALATEAGIRVDVASNPEFMREGRAVYDFMRPDRIVVGASDTTVAAKVAGLFASLEAPTILTSRRSAELGKYAANAILATRISFMNEMASISEALEADVTEIERIVGTDTRIGPAFLQAGLGWGGSCFPKDLSALSVTASRLGLDARIINAVVQVNHGQRERAVELLLEATANRPDPSVGILGLAFKPHTDDLRGAPALDIIERLLEQGIRVRAHDPAALAAANAQVPGPDYLDDPYEVTRGADALLLATEWPIYSGLDWARIRSQMRGRRLVDGRNVLPREVLERLGFDYRGFGRAPWAGLDEPAPLRERPRSAHATHPGNGVKLDTAVVIRRHDAGAPAENVA